MNRREVTPQDVEWPTPLNEIGPLGVPKRLFLEGNPLNLGTKAIAVVGTRRPTAAGVEAAEKFTRGLVEAGFSIVSGLAVGIDAVAHRTAIRCGGYTVAVLGCGLDVIYPKRNTALREEIASTGTLLTEFEEGTQPLPHHFPMRNRIVAGLCKGVLVIEGSFKSGALITARLALDANRSVWAVPGSVRNSMSQGPNELIRTGQAALVSDINHIFEDIAPSLVWQDQLGPPVSAPDLKEDELTVLSVLDDMPLSMDRIVRLSCKPMGVVALALSRLEVRGMILRRGPGYEVTASGARVRNLLAAQLEPHGSAD